MVRRGQQQRKTLRAARRKVTDELESPQGAYKRPDRDSCRHKSWETTYDDANTVRMQTHTWRKGGNLVDFVINAEVFTADGWVTVEYVDCCHGYCHHHAQNGGPPRPIAQLDDVDDVQHAFRAAQPVIYERLRIIRG